jgi:serine/threonine-protein kinase
MTIGSVENLVEVLRTTRLLQDDQQDELARILRPRYSDARTLGKVLVQKGWLTVFQVNAVFQDRLTDLVFGPYRALDRLGEGAASQVFKAVDTRNRRVVALKVMHPGMLSNAEAVGRFRREMQVVAQLAHNNIVRAFDVDLSGDRHFFAMEYVEGTDLGKLVQLSGRLAVGLACEYIRQAALGLQHAHERGLVHRDIKPGNLFLTAPRTRGAEAVDEDRAVPTMTTAPFLVKILDLGLARVLQPADGQPAVNLTQKGTVIGSPDYVAPEQARDASSADCRADVYSLGCTFYYLLTGQPPFPGNSLMQKLYDHQVAEPPALEPKSPGINADVAAIVRKMLAKLPDERYQTAAEVAAALAPFCSRNVPAAGPAAAKT